MHAFVEDQAVNRLRDDLGQKAIARMRSIFGYRGQITLTGPYEPNGSEDVAAALTFDADGKIIAANDAASVLFRCTCSYFKGKPIAAVLAVCAEKDPDQIWNAEGILPDGERLLLVAQFVNWRTDGGASGGTVFVHDVTEQISKQRSKAVLHQRYEAALTGGDIGVFEIDLQSGGAAVSETWLKIMGLEEGQCNFVHSRDFLARVHPEDMSALRVAAQDCIEGKISRSNVQYRIRFQDGWRWMYSDAVPAGVTSEGRATGLIGTQFDITELRHARNALELSEARFRTVLEDAPVGMAVLDEKADLISVNAALAQLCGYDADVLTSRMRLAQILSRKCYVSLMRDVRVLLRSGVAKTYQTQVQLRTRSGEECWGLFNLSWTYDLNHERYVYIAQVIDITQQKRIAQIKGEFISTVSHELRTPLTSIKGALGLLQATATSGISDSGARLLEIAQTNTDRLTLLVNNILDLEKISSGEVSFEPAPTPLRALIEGTVTMGVAGAAKEDRERIRLEGEEEVAVYVDAGRIRQVIGHLISNACKFSDPQTEVIVRIKIVDGMARVFFENTGAPIAESFQAQLFDAFTQADASDTRSKGGTGLGLSISREIVIRSGGEIGFEQGTGRTTVFWFSCPLALPDLDEEEDEFRAVQGLQNKRLRVLHIEEDVDFCDVLAAGFDGHADVVSAHTIAQARNALGTASWDAIIVDMMLPDGDTSHLLKEVRLQYPQTQVICLSSDSSPDQHAYIDLHLIKSQVGIAQVAMLLEQRVQWALAEGSRAAG